MGARGRKRSAELAVVRSITAARPQPPDDLTEAQAETWRAIVNRLPGNWFGRETLPILAAHLRHMSRRVGCSPMPPTGSSPIG